MENKKVEKKLLSVLLNGSKRPGGAEGLRENGELVAVKSTANVSITQKTDKPGLEVRVRDGSPLEFVRIPAIITKDGFEETVHNDFFIGRNARVIITAGCGIHNDGACRSRHDGVHRFFLEEGADVYYSENHYGEGAGTGGRLLNPQAEIHIGRNATLKMDMVQIKGVDSTVRTTEADLDEGASLLVTEKIMTSGSQEARTVFNVRLNGPDSKCQVTSRSYAIDDSSQEFVSNVVGNERCFAHIECDAIIKDNGRVRSEPAITANNVDAKMIHEAQIGKIAGEQLTKLMTLGLTQKEAEEEIINGFLS